MRSLIRGALSSLALLGAAAPAVALAPWQGEQRALVVLLEWSNVAATVDRATVETTFFGQAAGDFSARQFFQENARGKFDLTGDVLDWRRSATSFRSSDGCDLGRIMQAAWTVFGADIN